jgi:hypothetical protein
MSEAARLLRSAEGLDPSLHGVAANPHAHPAAIAAGLGHSSGAGRVAVWRSGGAEARWPLAVRHVAPGLAALSAPMTPLYDIGGAPLLPPGSETEALAGLVGAIRAGRTLPAVVVLRACPAEGPVREAFEALAAQGVVRLTPLLRWTRAVLSRDAAPDAESYLARSLSGSSRKRLRSKRKALEELGPLRFAVHAAPEAIPFAFARFAAVEASGWKGENGAALACRPDDARYVEAVLTGLAAHDRAFVATLDAGERTVAAGLFLRDGGEVFFWKTAYDSALAKQSPGVVFDQFVTEYLYARDWFRLLDTATDDSVDPDTLIWKERREMVSLVVDCAPGGFRGPAVVAALKLRQQLKDWRNRRIAQAK